MAADITLCGSLLLIYILNNFIKIFEELAARQINLKV